MTFMDATPDIERGVAAAGGHCCVRFKSSKKGSSWGEREREICRFMTRIVIVFLFCAMVVGIIAVPGGWGQ